MSQPESITVYLQDVKWNEPSISLPVEPEYTAHDVIKQLMHRTRLYNHNSYELAEIFVSSGQLCKERRLDMSEIPLNVKGLWPKGGALAPDATYRFYLVRKGGPGGFLRSLSWTDCSHHIDGSLDEYLVKFLAQKTAGENYADLCSLPDLNETTLLENLKKRFYEDTIYTYVGTILIAINPFKFFRIYNPKCVAMYQGGAHGLPPHIFAVANAAFTSMLDTQSDQCIVISGESGSGKTENTNFLLHHLTQNKLGQQQNHHGHGVEQTLLGAGPVLEAFGNAKTVHNDNSSRFGKFIQVDFRKNGAVHGASVEKYLLEKSRIVSQATNERNYHVFYYLLSGAPDDLSRELFLLDAKEYHYLNQSGCYTNPGENEVDEFERLTSSMKIVGFKPDLQKRIFAVISAILLLSNVEFIKKHTYHYDDAVQVKNLELVSRICKLLDVKEEAFLEALTSKRTIAGGETMVVRYKLEDAISARDAMAKCLYGAIFDWIVWQINHALFQKQDHKDSKSNSIGVLDIFGFEDFCQNSFEQFCINYANEHLQYYFNQHIFKYEQEEYRSEEIEWQNISFIDNRRCLDLFAKRPSGLFFLLDEEGNFPGATNETLLEKFHQNHKNSDFYEMPMRKESSFTIKHYAGKVKYHIKDFREKNSDLIHADLVSVLKNSNTGFVRELVGCDPVAMLRWSYVRLCMKCVNAFVKAGKTFHDRGGNKIGNIRRKTSVTQKTREHTNLPWSDNSETESSYPEPDDQGSFIHTTAKKTKRKTSARRKKYKDYKQFKTYQEVKNRETSKTKTPSVSLQFQKSLQSLLETLDRSHPYFVRCIKSNIDKTPCKFDNEFVRRQLRYTGMLATVKLRQSGYNYRVLFEDFVHKYAALLPKGKLSTRSDVDAFLTLMDSNSVYKNFQVGKTKNHQIGQSKVFLRETVKMLLDDALHHTLMRHIVRMQSWVRGRSCQTKYVAMKKATLVIQKLHRGNLARKEVAVLRLEVEKRQQELEVDRRRSMEVEEERKRQLEAAEAERKQKEAHKKEVAEVAARKIQEWYRASKALMDARILERAKKLNKEHGDTNFSLPVDTLPTTDIDQFMSLDAEDEATCSPSETKSSMVENWLDSKTPNINGHTELCSQSTDRRSIGSGSATEKQKEELDELKSIEANAQTKRSSEPVTRRTSITRKSAFRRTSTRDEDMMIPVVTKRTLPSPSTSTEDSELISPTPENLPLPSNNGTDNETSYPITSSHNAETVSGPSKSHIRAASDSTVFPNHTVDTEADLSRLKQKSIDFSSDNIFYTPTSRVETSSDKSGSVSEPPLPDIVIDRKLPNHLPVESTTDELVREKNDKSSTVANSKPPARRTSSNDPNMLRRINSRSDRTPDLLSPPDLSSPGDSSITRQSSRCSSVEDNGELKFTRTHVLRQNVHVRKSQSADNLAPVPAAGMTREHEMNLKQGKMNGPHTGNSKSQSYDTLTTAESLEVQKRTGQMMEASAMAAAEKRKERMKRATSDDSDWGDNFVKQEIPQQPHASTLPASIKVQTRSLSTKLSISSKPAPVSASQWNYPEDLAITECEEIPDLGRFIYDKYLTFRRADSDLKSVYDRVFRDAMKEMYTMLLTRSATCMGRPDNFHPLKFRDLMSSFKDCVTAQVNKSVPKKDVEDFPTTIAVNAFRGYLDEYQKKRLRRPPAKRKAPKTKQPKDQKKKPAKEQKDAKKKGHQMVAVQFTMPTFCEVCSKMMFWNIKDRGCQCAYCNLSCHKRCTPQITQPCSRQPVQEAEANSNAVFGIPLAQLAGEDNSVPPVLEKLIAELDSRGIYTDGIYRKSGAASRVRCLKKALDTDWEAVNLSDYAVHVISLTLKNFFRELPEPLFTFELYNEFIRCSDIANKEDALSAMRATVNKLPAVNISTISRLMLHLARIAQNEYTNRMSPNALAIVFAPNLVRTNAPMTAQQSLAQVEKQCKTLEMMLEATMKKLDTTLQDLDQLEAERQVLETRLSNVRQSMRRPGAPSKPAKSPKPPIMHPLGEGEAPSSEHTRSAPTSSPSTPTSETVDMEYAQQEERAISEKIRNVQERKDQLRLAIPRLTLTTSDGDDMLSGDDLESSAESLDDLE
ncbi:unconventional myosin-IXb-like isoform X2 [Watersipora subatra]|uniref:unconventional myosin-IXb-like isoform X2 n=1 Tax=Watersipora subatra TaxID=2589382 RepID=UPI00355B0546